ncbi:restriction endonuclease subunit S [Methanosphaera cuniculi]|uniref:restriction endonuclease subunit S n=1 Tax=Methanosphaera cuniculi TaxID=1077256 RepID=UPI0026EA224A|nr:restriction endonuclease subunit S [Methanosphaera cuniculi]
MYTNDSISSGKVIFKNDSPQKILQLRFPNFDDNWQEVKLKDITNINPKTSEIPNSFYYIDLESVNSGKLINKNKIDKKNAPSRAQRLLQKNDILFSSVRPYQQNNLIFKFDNDSYVASTGFIQIRSDISNINYLYYYLHTHSFLNKVLRFCTGSNYPTISSNDLKNIKIKIPTIQEQEKIGTFLSKIDGKIALMEKKQEELEIFKKYIINNLFNSTMIKDGWKSLPLKEFLHEHKLKSTGSEEVYSVSVSKGVVNQVEHMGRSFSAKNTDKYNLVQPDDIIYTKSPTGDFPYGIIKQSHENKNVIVSPLYGVFKPKTKELGYILENYFESPVHCHNYLHSLVQIGAKHTMNITNKTFLSKELYIPVDHNEQKKIYNTLYSLNKKIELVKKEIELVNKYKRGLIQKMFI